MTNSCAPKATQDHTFKIYECPRPIKPSFGTLSTSRFDSLERQKEILNTLNIVRKYSKDQDATIDCYEMQINLDK